MTPPTPSRATRLVLLGAIVLAYLPGCTPEERIVNYKPFLAGVDGSPEGVSVKHNQAHIRDGEVVGSGSSEARQSMNQPIVVENEDGSITLRSKSGLHLIRHIQRTLYNDERDLFTEQVLSDMTRREYLERGLDPGEAFDTLKERERDVNVLASRMPLGEYTPQVLRTKVGHNMFRLRVNGVGVRDLYWRGFDMVLEGGDWKLRWFVH